MPNDEGAAYIAMIDQACATANEWRLGDFNTAAARFFIASVILEAMELGKQQTLNAINTLHQSGAAITCAANCTCELCYLEARHAE